MVITSTAKLSFGRMIMFKAWLRHIKIKLSFICLFEFMLSGFRTLRGKREIGCYKLMCVCVCVVYLENIRVHNGEEINDCFEE